MTARIGSALALVWLGLLLVAPVVMVVVRTFSSGSSPVVAALTAPAAVHAALLSLLLAAIAVPVNTVFGVVCALVLVRFRPPGRAADRRRCRPAVRRVARRARARPVRRSTAAPAGSGPCCRRTASTYLRSARAWCSPPSSCRCPSSSARSRRCWTEVGTDAEQAAVMLGASGWQTFTADHAARDPLGGHLRDRPDDGPGAGGVRRGRDRLRQPRAAAPRPCRCYVEDRFTNFDLTGAYAAGTLARPHRGGRARRPSPRLAACGRPARASPRSSRDHHRRATSARPSARSPLSTTSRSPCPRAP